MEDKAGHRHAHPAGVAKGRFPADRQHEQRHQIGHQQRELLDILLRVRDGVEVSPDNSIRRRQAEFQILPEGVGQFVGGHGYHRQQQAKQQPRQPAQRHPRQKAQIEETKAAQPHDRQQKQREKAHHPPIVRHPRGKKEGRQHTTTLRARPAGIPAATRSPRRTAAGRASRPSSWSRVPRTSAANRRPPRPAAAAATRCRIVSREKSLASRWRCASVRSCGSSATDRASRPSASAAHTAENKFNASGITGAGSQRNGHVTRKVTGPNTSGCQVQPEIFATELMLNSDTQ